MSVSATATILTGVVFNLLSFLTTWNLILLLAWPLTSKVFNLGLSTLIVSVMAVFVTYVHPKKFCLVVPPRTCITQTHGLLGAWDVLLHHTPLLILAVAAWHRPEVWIAPFWSARTFNTVGMLAVYVAVMEPAKIYTMVSV